MFSTNSSTYHFSRCKHWIRCGIYSKQRSGQPCQTYQIPVNPQNIASISDSKSDRRFSITKLLALGQPQYPSSHMQARRSTAMQLKWYETISKTQCRSSALVSTQVFVFMGYIQYEPGSCVCSSKGEFVKLVQNVINSQLIKPELRRLHMR